MVKQVKQKCKKLSLWIDLKTEIEKHFKKGLTALIGLPALPQFVMWLFLYLLFHGLNDQNQQMLLSHKHSIF